MRTRTAPRWLNTVWLVLVKFGVCTLGVCALCLSSCGVPPEEDLALLVPGLPDEMRVHLAHDDETDFTRFCSEQGITAVLDARTILRRALDRRSPDGFQSSWRQLEPHLGRLTRQLAVTYGCTNYQSEHAYWDRLPPEDALALLHREDRLNALYLDPELLVAEKILRLDEHARAFRAAGYWAGVIWCQVASAEFAAALGRDTEEEAFIRDALRISRGQAMPIMEARLLTMLGERYREQAEVDSMAAVWERALAIGQQHRLPEQAADVHSHWARFYAGQGRLALAANHHRSAQEVCRLFRGGYLELPLVLDAMYFHAELGFWDVVGRLLEHAHVLQRSLEEAPRPLQRRSYDLHLQEMEARYLSALGMVAEAEILYEQLEQATEAPTFRMNYPRLMYARAEGLLAAGRPTEALPVIGKGLVQALARSLPGTRARFTSLLARTLWTLGNDQAAERTLRDFVQQAQALGEPGEALLRREWIFHDACQAHLALAEQDRKQAHSFLDRGLARLGGYLREIDASEEGYMFLESAEDLRWALHDYVGEAPGPSYLLEVAWNELPSLLGAGARDDGIADRSPFAPVPRDPLEALRTGLERPPTEELETFFRFLQSQRAHHLLFASLPAGVVRWTAGEGGIHRDTLALSPEGLRAELDVAIRLLSRDPATADAPPGDSLALRLGRLRKDLLPEGLGNGATQVRPLLLITADGLLEQLPFEALNLAWPPEPPTDDPPKPGLPYRPLLADTDVAYLRSSRFETPPMVGSRGMVVSDPALAASHLRRYPNLRRLTGTRAEAAQIGKHFPEALTLQQEAATKAAILASWPGASFFYAAAHFVRDPEVPYVTFLPVAPPPGAHRPDQMQLGVLDIRSLDLRRCQLVTLSGCATGAAYTMHDRQAPSLGDACLDAGVEIVIETLWHVRDDDAYLLMERFIEQWAGQNEWAVRALNEARREQLRGPRGYRHPFTWAAYVVTLGHL